MSEPGFEAKEVDSRAYALGRQNKTTKIKTIK